MDAEKVVLDSEAMRRTLVRIGHEIVEGNADREVAIVGIHRRGAILAVRLHQLVSDLLGEDLPLGDIDIAFYRDDFATRPQHPVLPIRPDYVGKNLPTARAERVNVRVEELDGIDEVTITQPQEAPLA